MKRGKLRPNAATRWPMGLTTGSLYPPPMYARVEFLALMLWPVEDPDLLPVPITGADATIGMYSYETGDGAVVWAGEWENVYGGGEWHFGQMTAGELGAITHFALSYGPMNAGFVIYNNSQPDFQNGIWNDAFVDRHGASNWRMPSYPWVFLDFESVRAVNYDELRTLRYPTRPNHPYHFFYDP